MGTIAAVLLICSPALVIYASQFTILAQLVVNMLYAGIMLKTGIQALHNYDFASKTAVVKNDVDKLWNLSQHSTALSVYEHVDTPRFRLA